MNYTSIEKSKKLLQLGMSPETADMHIVNQNYGDHGCFKVGLEYHAWDACHVDGYIPCWSVGALINAMPKIITVNNQECYLHIYHTILGSMAIEYSTFEENTLQYFDDKDLLEVIYYMTCWLLENNYIKKE